MIKGYYETEISDKLKYLILLGNDYWKENCYPDKVKDWAALRPVWEILS